MITLESSLDTFKVNSMADAMQVSSDNKVISAVDNSNIGYLRETINNITGLKVDFITITDDKGKVLIRTNSENSGDSIIENRNIAMAINGETSSFMELGKEIPFSLTTVLPIKNSNGKVVGTVSGGFSMVKTEFIDELKNETGNEFTIFIGDERVNTTIIRDGKRAIGTTLDPKIAKVVLEREEELFWSNIHTRHALFCVI